MEKEHFTTREVGALIESLRSEFRVVAEAVSSLLPLINRMEKVEERLTSVEDVMRIAFPAINARFTRIEMKLGIV